ncbi:uncharacterized protein AAG666_023293 isoform 1-T2 [Megaptera novaeangliae]
MTRHTASKCWGQRSNQTFQVLDDLRSPAGPSTDFLHVVGHTATSNSCVPHLTILLQEEKQNVTKVAHLLAPSLTPVEKSQEKPLVRSGETRVNARFAGGVQRPLVLPEEKRSACRPQSRSTADKRSQLHLSAPSPRGPPT